MILTPFGITCSPFKKKEIHFLIYNFSMTTTYQLESLQLLISGQSEQRETSGVLLWHNIQNRSNSADLALCNRETCLHQCRNNFSIPRKPFSIFLKICSMSFGFLKKKFCTCFSGFEANKWRNQDVAEETNIFVRPQL